MFTVFNTRRVNEHPLPKSEVPCRFQQRCNHQEMFGKPCPFKHTTVIQSPLPPVPVFASAQVHVQSIVPVSISDPTPPPVVVFTKEEIAFMNEMMGEFEDEFNELDEFEELDEFNEFDDFVQDPEAYDEEWIETVNALASIQLA